MGAPTGHRTRGTRGVTSDESWRDQAACRDMDPGIFYPAVPNLGSRYRAAAAKAEAEARAKAVCASCPVTQECLDYALSRPKTDDFGVWGCTTQAERIVIRATRRQLVGAAR